MSIKTAINCSVAGLSLLFSVWAQAANLYRYTNAEGVTTTEPLLLNYGAFIQSVFDFTIIALCIFVMIKMVNNARVALEGEPEPEVKEDPADIQLLREIRDALKKG